MPRNARRRRQQRWWGLAVVLLCLGVAGPQRVAIAGHSLSTTNLGAMPVRVMTWNAYFRNQNQAAFFATVVKEQPDIIAIQELGAPLAEAIRTGLQAIYPYQVRYPAKIPAGLALLSRYPFSTTTPPDFSEATGCNCQIVTIAIAERSVTIINTHPWPAKSFLTGGKLLEFNTENQDRIFEQILARVEQAAGPLLLTGDLNTMPIQANYRRLSASLHDAYAESGIGPANTFPVSRTTDSWLTQPVLRIDYIFHDEAWQAHRSWVGTIAGSDHRYVMAELTLSAR